MTTGPVSQDLSLDRIFLDLKNPRHKPYESEADVIRYLCAKENIATLAADIVKYGLNPIERFALIPDGSSETDPPNYFVAEGNRRICALKLLDDPDRAPTEYRKPFRAMAAKWGGISLLSCVIFESRDAVDLWLGRIHDGQQGGIGRKGWNATQSQRHSGSTKNKLALKILDHAEARGLITEEGRDKKLTTVQRYVSKKPIQEVMGIDASNLDDVKYLLPEADFDNVLRKFLGDLEQNIVNSRSKGDDAYVSYATELASVVTKPKSQQGGRPLAGPKSGGKPPKAPKPPAAPVTIPRDEEILEALSALGNFKLESLYHSICRIGLADHTPLLTVGAWAFLESLTGAASNGTRSNFQSHFSRDRLRRYGIPKSQADKNIDRAISNIADLGDATKHAAVAANFNGTQLANDMETLKKVILECVREATPKA